MTVSPKIKITLVVLIILAGCGFMAFAYFFNRSTLEITSDAPFSIQITGVRSEYCQSSPCSITVAPGHYEIEISKTDFESVKEQVDLNLGQTLSKTYHLSATPKVTPIGPWNPENLFNTSPGLQNKLQALSLNTSSTTWTLVANQLAKISGLNFLEINSDASWIVAENAQAASAIPTNPEKTQPISLTPGINYYFAPHSNTIYFIADNPDNSLPSLYRKNLDSSDSPERLLNFIRTIPNPLLIISPDQSRLAMLERPDQKSSSLYLLDLKTKTRRVINQQELISDFLWLPPSTTGLTTQPIIDQSITPDNSTTSTLTTDSTPQNFLIEKINSQTLLPNLYLANTVDPENQALLPLSTRLSALYPLDSTHLILAQPSAAAATTSDLATPAATPPDLTAPGFTLLNFDLSSLQTQTIFPIPDYTIPQKIEYSLANHTLYFLINSTVYSLAPIL